MGPSSKRNKLKQIAARRSMKPGAKGRYGKRGWNDETDTPLLESFFKDGLIKEETTPFQFSQLNQDFNNKLYTVINYGVLSRRFNQAKSAHFGGGDGKQVDASAGDGRLNYPY